MTDKKSSISKSQKQWELENKISTDKYLKIDEEK